MVDSLILLLCTTIYIYVGIHVYHKKKIKRPIKQLLYLYFWPIFLIKEFIDIMKVSIESKYD